MADEETTPAVKEALRQAQDAHPQAGDAPEPETDSIDKLPKWARDLVSDLRKENAKHRTEKVTAEKAALEAQRKAAEEQGRYQELYEIEKAKIAELEREKRELELSTIRSHVGIKFNLGPVFTGLLRGDTQEEMEAHAREIVEALPKRSANADANAGTNSRPAGLKPVEQLKQEKISRDYNAL